MTPITWFYYLLASAVGLFAVGLALLCVWFLYVLLIGLGQGKRA